jgi:hypothetical protein
MAWTIMRAATTAPNSYLHKWRAGDTIVCESRAPPLSESHMISSSFQMETLRELHFCACTSRVVAGCSVCRGSASDDACTRTV